MPNKKSSAKKNKVADSLIIEQLACLEVNNLILKPPFHLISYVQFNDRGISFDGEIGVFKSPDIKKENFIKNVPVQVKGTTIQKTIIKTDRIIHSVKKRDLEVYYEQGEGVLYFVVTINPITLKRQAYYKIIAPLELKALLKKIEANGRDSISLEFKVLDNNLENICKVFIDLVEKQPKQYIEMSNEREYKFYKLEIVDVEKGNFNLFNETAYIYGVTSDDIVMPLEATTIEELKLGIIEVVNIDGEEFKFNYQVTEAEKFYTINVESTLTIQLDKNNKKGVIHLGRIITFDSYMKCLRIIKYLNENGSLPFQKFHLNVGTLDDEFQDIDEEILSYEELIDVCDGVGIKRDFEFDEHEDLPILFNAIMSIFKDKKYEMIKIKENSKLEDHWLYNIELSKFVRLNLVYLQGEFRNFYSDYTLKSIGGFIPKSNIEDNETETTVKLEDNLEENYQKVSIYMTHKIENMLKDSNFDFEILKLSYTADYHDITSDQTINVSLDFINYYFETLDSKYLDFALDLNQRFLDNKTNDDISRININLIKLIKHEKLTDLEQNEVIDIQERAEKNNNHSIRFACEVLLLNKVKASRIFSTFDYDEQEKFKEFPIYYFYENRM